MSSTARTLSPTVSAAAVVGWIGGVAAWWIVSSWRDTNALWPTNGRLDQWCALVFGACVGAGVLGARARYRREPVVMAASAGSLLGGVMALIGATTGLLLPTGDTATRFVLARMLTWSLMSAAAAAGLSLYTRSPRTARTVESALLGAIGGAIGGAIYSLPGPSEMWLALAMSACGAAIAFAAIGPGMWRAPVVVQILPARNQRHSMWSLQERAVESNWSTLVGDAHIGCVDREITIYPPPAGASLDGYPLYRALTVRRTSLLSVGRIRARVIVGGAIGAMFLAAPRVVPLHAQPVATWRLVRCGPQRTAQCLAARIEMPALTVPDSVRGRLRWNASLADARMAGADDSAAVGGSESSRHLVFGAPFIPATPLHRTSLYGFISLEAVTGPVLRVPARWRPPMLAAPLFEATADSAALPSALREALALGTDPPAIRPLLSLMLLLTCVMLVSFVPRFLWSSDHDSDEDMAREVAQARALLSTKELEQLRGRAPREMEPRSPDEATRESVTLPRSTP